MASSSNARTPSTPDDESRSGPGWPLVLGTACLAAYAAVASTIVLLGGSRGGGESDALSKASTLDRQLLDAQASRLRDEMASDFRNAVDEAKQQCATVAQQAKQLQIELNRAVEAATRKADDLSKSAHARIDPLDEKAVTLSKEIATAKTSLDALAVTVKDLEKRPAAAAPAPVAPTPAEPPPGPTPAPAPATPPPPPVDDPVARKARVKQAIADLSDADLGRVYAAAVFLGTMGDLEAVEPLVKVMREHKDPFMRIPATAALGELHACDAVPALIDTFMDKDPSVVNQAGQSLFKITDQDSGLSADASRKDKNEAKAKATKWWREHEGEVRIKWGQPKGGAPPADPAMDGG